MNRANASLHASVIFGAGSVEAVRNLDAAGDILRLRRQLGIERETTSLGGLFDSLARLLGSIIDGFARLFGRSLFFTSSDQTDEQAKREDRGELPHGIDDHLVIP